MLILIICYSLNLSRNELGSWLVLERTIVLTFIVVRAFAGKLARNTRQVFEVVVKGLNLEFTSVMCFVIILTGQSFDKSQSR